ncbi:MAG: hypothetical protein K2X62_04205 [Beijerinckiaceae bacterium]|nr:hypothetical protein [Beijerinckiaceae bacterium]
MAAIIPALLAALIRLVVAGAMPVLAALFRRSAHDSALIPLIAFSNQNVLADRAKTRFDTFVSAAGLAAGDAVLGRRTKVASSAIDVGFAPFARHRSRFIHAPHRCDDRRHPRPFEPKAGGLRAG